MSWEQALPEQAEGRYRCGTKWYVLITINKLASYIVSVVVLATSCIILCINLYTECEVPYKMSDHEEVNQMKSSCSSSKCI